MTVLMTPDEQIAALVRQGVPREKAERVVGRRVVSLSAEETSAHHVVVDFTKALAYPIRLSLPWSALCPDNERESASIIMRGGKPYPRKVLTARYKAAAEKVRAIARAAMTVDGFKHAPLTDSLSLVARVFTPTQRRVDIANFEKGVHDALSRIIYVDDQQLQDIHWLKIGPDIDRPRVELEVRPL